jgi:environmental stress-induced protein Ves
MPIVRPLPRSTQHEEAWANHAGSTTVILREPDDADWTVRVSVAKVERDGPFSDWPGTRRTLVPLDAPMTLRFANGCELAGTRFRTLRFEGSPPPFGILPEGPTRDFNLMLRGGARGEVLPRTLVDSMMLPAGEGLRWLAYLDSGSARIDRGAAALVLEPRDAALVAPGDGAGPLRIEGAGEIVLVKLYA